MPAGESYRGLDYSEPGYVWVGAVSKNRVYRYAATSGSLVSFWVSGPDPSGLAPRGTGDGGLGLSAIISTDANPARISFHDVDNGNVVDWHVLANPSIYDCAYDHRNDVVLVGYTNNFIYAYAGNGGSVVGSFASPAATPVGLAYYGECLWVACTGPAPDHIY